MNGEPQALLNGYKDLVKGWVPKVRDVLDKDFTAELNRLGIPASGKAAPIERMNLPDEDRRVRARVEALLRRDSISEGSDQKGFENVRRELSYTCLNRLVGLKCMEARKLLYLPPPGDAAAAPELTEVITNIPGQARSRYLRDLRATGGSRYKYGDNAEEALLRDGLTAVYRFITSEIQVLFDPDHEYACLWPTHGCLTRVIAMINDDLPDAVYRAQDFLGWVYQFFNREEKRKVRDENKGTPRSSYELSVINQFYTPSWVVKALVDNTLGRLWLQMHPDSALRPTAPPPLPSDGNWYHPVADYLVPNTGEKIRYERLTDEEQAETFKRAADISLLDPACGTMHFGQYAFGLFHQMYLDEIRHAGEPGWPAEPSIRDPEAIPAAIIERNLFGIDIDARAIQIASLSLMLTAKEAAVREGHAPLGVRLRRSNLVVANAVNIGEDQLRALVARLGERLGSRSLREALFQTIWENLRQVGELGSLIQVQEGVTRVLDEWVDRQAHQRGITRIRAPKNTGQLVLESVVAEVELDQRQQMELERRLLEEEAAQVRRDLLSGLEEIARSETDPTQRLFAEDTARGLKLLETLSRRYDVVVMNPPYGSFVPKVRDFIKAVYPLTWNDIYATFIERGAQLTLSEMLARCLRGMNAVRSDVPRRDFSTIEGSPLAYSSVALLSPLFRAYPKVQPGWGIAQRGAPTAEDERLVREHWEISGIPSRPDVSWAPFSKGGDYCRYYYDVHLCVAWSSERKSFHNWFGRPGRPIERPESADLFFESGLTWPMRTQRGFNVRVLPAGCIFSHKSGFMQARDRQDEPYLLGVLNSFVVEYILTALTSFGSYEAGAVKRVPIPPASSDDKSAIGKKALAICESKRDWDKGNETSTIFEEPWLLRRDFLDPKMSIADRLEFLEVTERQLDDHVQALHAEVGNDVTRVYGLSSSTRVRIAQALGDRPKEVIWPQMEGRSVDQKRMEHVWRLLSFTVKRVVESDYDGLIPLLQVNGETPLLDRVRAEMAKLFPALDANEVEVEIANELKRKVKGYDRVDSIEEWLGNQYFAHHASTYKKRPIFWHISSRQGKGPAAFSALVHYHRFDKDRMAKLRGIYLREALTTFRREAALASQQGRGEDRLEWQAKVEEIEELDRRLQKIQEGFHEGAEDYRILTPWKSEAVRPKGWDPDINDGVKVNIEPLQRAGVLRIAEVV